MNTPTSLKNGTPVMTPHGPGTVEAYPDPEGLGRIPVHLPLRRMGSHRVWCSPEEVEQITPSQYTEAWLSGLTPSERRRLGF